MELEKFCVNLARLTTGMLTDDIWPDLNTDKIFPEENCKMSEALCSYGNTEFSYSSLHTITN
jgi:hypothetical protein